MAQRKKNKKAEAAMEIADKFKEIIALSDLIRAKVWEVEHLIKVENLPREGPRDTFGLRTAHGIINKFAARGKPHGIILPLAVDILKRSRVRAR